MNDNIPSRNFLVAKRLCIAQVVQTKFIMSRLSIVPSGKARIFINLTCRLVIMLRIV